MTKREAKRQAYNIAAQLLDRYLLADGESEDPADEAKIEAALRAIQHALEARADAMEPTTAPGVELKGGDGA